MSGIAKTMPPDDEDALLALLRLAGPRPAVSAERSARVRAAVHGSWRAAYRRETRRRLGGTLVALGAAAALVLLLGRPAPTPETSSPPVATVERVIGSASAESPHAQGRPPLARGDVVLAGTVVETGEQGRAALRIGPASLRVDRDTTVRLVTEGVLELDRGAVYVDTGQRGTGLELRTTLGVVRDVGTRFEVRTQPGDLRVRVRDGEVVLDRAGQLDRVGAGTELVLADGRLRRRTVSPDNGDWAWASSVAASFELEGRRLREFLDWYASETGRAWRLAPGLESRADTVLHGSVADLTPDDALQVVLPICGLEARIERGTVRIVVVGAEERR
jgi:ferric-dicitrate binding protein FerR (iron transport regulator)